MTDYQKKVIDLRKSGLMISEIAKMLGGDRKYIGSICRNNGLGQTKEEQSRASSQPDDYWIDKVLKVTSGMFEYVDSEIDSKGERKIICRCTKCGTVKEYSSVSFRTGKDHRCVVCNRENRKRIDQIDKAILEYKKEYERGKSLVQMQMNFCECGRLIPFGRKACEGCINTHKRQSRRRKEHKRRVRILAEFDADITLEKLYERDNGICYLCYKTCDWQDFQRINGAFVVGGSYPTVEHVKPLCKGGTHTWSNIKLACHACNSKKGRKY